MRRVVWITTLAGEFRIAVIHDTHADWLKRLGLPVEETISKCVRGYVDEHGVHFYRTFDFSATAEDEAAMVRVLPKLVEKMPRITDATPVIAGYDPDELGHYFGGPRTRVVGTVGELLRGAP